MKPARMLILTLLLGCILFISGCRAPQPAAKGWELADLRLLETPGAPDPAFDLVSAYARQSGADVELRFEWLGSPAPDAYDFYLAVDYQPGEGGRLPLEANAALDWDLLLAFPAKGLPHAIASNGRLAAIRPRSVRSAMQDSFTALIDQRSLGAGWENARYQAFLTRPGETALQDSIGPFGFDTQATVKAAPLVLVFWDALPAATPAQVLRRWDGAHTGPFGQRHGLKILLEAASETKVPLAVLDLQRADSLAALEALGGLNLVREMQRSGLLLIPDAGFGDSASGAWSLQANTQAASRYRLRRTSLFYGTAAAGLEGQRYQAVFGKLGDPAHIPIIDGKRVIPLPASLPGNGDSAGPAGLAVEARRALLLTALSPQTDDLVVLGGSLPSSPWGDLYTAYPALADIAGRPWIQALSEKELLDFPAVKAAAGCAGFDCLKAPEATGRAQQVRDALQQAPDNLFSQLARQAYLGLTQPTGDPQLAALREAYIGQVGPLLSAAQWSQSPAPQEGCTVDVDWDGENECILATEHYFFVIDPHGGRLTLGAARTKAGTVQIIGQRSQFIVGLGDPSGWRPELGAAGDAEDIPGGFAGPGDAWQPYTVEARPGTLVLSLPQGGAQKVFSLDDQGLRVSYTGDQPLTTQLPAALIDSNFLSPGEYAQYRAATGKNGELRLSLSGRTTLVIESSGALLQRQSFFDSLSMLSSAEDPNFGYPPGHRTPFPLIIVQIQGEKRFEVRLSLQ